MPAHELQCTALAVPCNQTPGLAWVLWQKCLGRLIEHPRTGQTMVLRHQAAGTLAHRPKGGTLWQTTQRGAGMNAMPCTEWSGECWQRTMSTSQQRGGGGAIYTLCQAAAHMQAGARASATYDWLAGEFKMHGSRSPLCWGGRPIKKWDVKVARGYACIYACREQPLKGRPSGRAGPLVSSLPSTHTAGGDASCVVHAIVRILGCGANHLHTSLLLVKAEGGWVWRKMAGSQGRPHRTAVPAAHGWKWRRCAPAPANAGVQVHPSVC